MNIKNLNIYNRRMELGVIDKLHFLTSLHEDITTIVDFGCANAALGLAIMDNRQDLKYVGYDSNMEMVIAARENTEFTIYSNFLKLLDNINPSHSILVLSSVLHEIYSYNSNEDIKSFWELILNSGFKQIAIRDMGLETDDIKNNGMNMNFEKVENYISQNTGSLPVITTCFGDLYQLFLKYWYKENWEREVEENYFALTVEELQRIVSKSKYTVDSLLLFKLQFVVDKVQKDFDFNPFVFTTHYKIILNLDI